MDTKVVVGVEFDRALDGIVNLRTGAICRES